MVNGKLNSEVVIAGRRIGAGHEPYIIAEAGINHNGELDKVFDDWSSQTSWSRCC